ncbi:hypothetical protein GMB51_11260 [Turicibacter sanguinis]|nr:hypothetical protein [Turicibacter sanguinis]MTN51526.1 hypothetical protein [Turicibacter sanguinis]MTN54724.1 hypothetical protein [Turicibacter sanguinis]MTN57807.1 hypothetical protein [Turicibacter sanguinis]MTN60922.1 hypothetical protein [Turicibacter sanguinis]
MNKKYIMFVLVFFICFTSLTAKAHPKSAQFIEGKDDMVECLEVVFENPNFRISFSSGNGEIMGWTVPEGAEDITKEEWCYILVDCAEKIFGKGTDRYEVNKEKFMNMIEELKE